MIPHNNYYLDCGHGNKYGDRTWCDPFKTFWDIYKYDPYQYSNDTDILGGEVTAWSEMLSQYNLHSFVWPRSAAMADRLWGEYVENRLVNVQKVVHR